MRRERESIPKTWQELDLKAAERTSLCGIGSVEMPYRIVFWVWSSQNVERGGVRWWKLLRENTGESRGGSGSRPGLMSLRTRELFILLAFLSPLVVTEQTPRAFFPARNPRSLK